MSTHPGVSVRDRLNEMGMTQTWLARVMKRPLKTINEIVNGKTSITAETALQLELYLDIDAIDWLYDQAKYDLAVARKKASSK